MNAHFHMNKGQSLFTLENCAVVNMLFTVEVTNVKIMIVNAVCKMNAITSIVAIAVYPSNVQNGQYVDGVLQFAE